MSNHDLELVLPVGTSLLAWVSRVRGPEDVRASPPEVVASLRRASAADRTCAELDSIDAWCAQNPARARRVRAIRVLHSDTADGAWVADVLTKLLPDTEVGTAEITCHCVDRLAADERMDKGIRGFVHLLGDLRKRAFERGRGLVINATAGYKAESGLALLFGALTGNEVFYRHEAMAESVSFPPIPLQWALTKEDRLVLEEIGKGAERDTVRELVGGRRAHLWPFLEQLDDLWALSALGELVVTTAPAKAAHLRTRDGEVVFKDKASERGHAPPDASAIAARIGERLPFVKEARLVGWRRGSEGLQVRGPDEGEDWRIFLHRGRGPHEGTVLRWLLTTTAEDETEWMSARQRVGEAFGRASLDDEVSRQLEAFGVAPEEFAALALEAKLEKSLAGHRAELQRAREHAESVEVERDNAREGLDRQRRRAELCEEKRRDLNAQKTRLEEELEKANDKIAELRNRLRAAEEKRG